MDKSASLLVGAAPRRSTSSLDVVVSSLRLALRLTMALAQLAVVVYVGLMAWLSSAWMQGGHWASTATNSEWWSIALQRFGIGVLAAAAVGLILLLANRTLDRIDISPVRSKPIVTAAIGAGIVLVSSLWGVIQFVITRPFM